jgi:opacity protein-like surface antigen
MKRRLSTISLTIGAMFSFPALSLAQDNSPNTPEFTLGIKAWDTYWQSYLPSTVAGFTSSGQPIIGEVVNSVEGSKKVEALPTLTVRYDRYFISAGYARFSSDFAVSQSPVTSPAFTNVITSRVDHISRRELDINAGYFVLPGLALTLGYKNGREERDTRSGLSPASGRLLDAKLNALLVGALAAFEVKSGLSAYGQFGYGVGRTKTTLGEGFGTFAGETIRSNAKYIVSEVGLAYTLPFEISWLRRTSVALGYRSQTIKQNVPSVLTGESRQLRDVKDGFVLSLNATF